MIDHAAFGKLPPDHWIHKALAKTKKKKAAAKQAKPAAQAPAMNSMQSADPGDHEYR